MSNIQELHNIISSYSKALLVSRETREELEDFAENALSLEKIIKENDNLIVTLASPIVHIDKKLELIDLVAKHINLQHKFQTFLHVIITNGRGRFLKAIIESFIALYNQETEKLTVELITAKEALDPKTCDQIKTKLKKVYNQEIILHNNIDQKIISGFIIKIGSKYLDYSMLNQLTQLKSKCQSRILN